MRKIVKWLILKNAINEEDEELYAYGLQSLLLLVSPIMFAIIFGLLFGVFKTSILVVIPFMILRKFSGGYHMRYLWKCIIFSISIIGLAIWISSKIQVFSILHLLVCFSCVSLIILSPVDSRKRELNFLEKRQYKKIVIIILVIFFISYLALWLIGLYDGAGGLGMGIILAFCMQVPCVFKKVRWY